LLSSSFRQRWQIASTIAFLDGKEAVDIGRRHAEFGRDVGDRGLGEAEATEQRVRGFHDAGAGIVGPWSLTCAFIGAGAGVMTDDFYNSSVGESQRCMGLFCSFFSRRCEGRPKSRPLILRARGAQAFAGVSKDGTCTAVPPGHGSRRALRRGSSP
jgi:hypothetical protein